MRDQTASGTGQATYQETWRDKQTTNSVDSCFGLCRFYHGTKEGFRKVHLH